MRKHRTLLSDPIVGLRSSWFIKDIICFAAKSGEKMYACNLCDEIPRVMASHSNIFVSHEVSVTITVLLL